MDNIGKIIVRLLAPASYNVSNDVDIIEVDTSSGGITNINLQKIIISDTRKTVYISDVSNNANIGNINISTTGGNLINNASFITLSVNGIIAEVNIADTNRFIANLSTDEDSPPFTGYVPYTGATNTLNLGSQHLQMDIGSYILDSIGAQKIDVNGMNLWDTNGIGSINWASRYLINPLGTPLLDWSGAELQVSTSIQMGSYDVNANTFRGNQLANTFNQSLIDLSSFAYYDGSGVVAINMNNRQLLESNGYYPSIDWGNSQLWNIGVSNGVPLLDWSTGAGGSVKIYNGYTNSVVGDFSNYQLIGSNGLSLDWNSYLLYDNTNSISVDWSNKYLITNYGASITLDWQNGYLSDTSNVVSIAWSERNALDPTGSISFDWNFRQCVDSLGYVAFDWQLGLLRNSDTDVIDIGNKILFNSSGVNVFGWTGSAPVISGSEYLNAGAIWTDTARKALMVYQNSIKQVLNGVIFTQTATGTVANSTVEGSVSSSGIGSLSLPVNFFVAGKTIRISGRGFHSSTATPTLNLKIKFGSTVINTTGTHSMHNTTNAYFEFDTIITCRTTGASGTVFAQGKMFDGTDNISMGNIATTTVNTTIAQAITVTSQWSVGSSANTISMTNLTVEILN